MVGAVTVDGKTKRAGNAAQAALARPGNDFIMERLGPVEQRAELLEPKAPSRSPSLPRTISTAT